MAISQSMQLKLQQKLSPMQIQLIKLLEIPTAQIEQRIKEEMEANPVLEVDEQATLQKEREQETEPQINAPQDEQPDDGTGEGYLLNEDIPAYKLQANNYSDDDDRREGVPVSEAASFYEHLEGQIGLTELSDWQQLIAKYIIGNIDEDGYLRRDIGNIADDISFATGKDVADDEVAKVLEAVQRLDPPGVGARDLRECLLLQLRKARKPTADVQNAIAVIETCFDDFSKHHYDKVGKRLQLPDEALKAAVDVIMRLNPKPGSAYGGGAARQAQHVIPDFIIDYDNGELGFHLNQRGEPELKISSSYASMLREYETNKANQTQEQKDAATFVKDKIKSAQWFIDAIKQRRNTLTLVMQAIMDYQGDYFIDGDETKLKPMVLKDIAARTGLDVSTISRVSNSKYVQTTFGIFPLKYFFSEGIQNADGDDVSTREVKSILREAVDNEDKRVPLTDEKLVEILAQKSYNIARRTVAKYREQLGIPVARLRKSL